MFYIPFQKIRGWEFANRRQSNVILISGNVFCVLLGLRKHDVCFLITVRPTKPYGTKFDRRRPFVEQVGLVYVRGCEVQGMLDDKGRVIEDGMVICMFERLCIRNDKCLCRFSFLCPRWFFLVVLYTKSTQRITYKSV